MIRTVLAAAAMLLALAVPAIAQTADTTVHVGTTLNDLLIAYSGVIGTLLSALAAWALWKFTGIKIEANARNAIETFAVNAAGSFLSKFDTLKAVQINVNNPVIAQLANDGLKRIPDALRNFGMGPEDLKTRIVEKIGILTATDTSGASAPTALPPHV